MSDTPREPDPSLGGAAVDQGARAAEIEIPTEDDVVETLRQQLAALEEQGSEKDKALDAEKQRVASAERARQDAEARARQADQQARQTQHQSERSTAQAQLDSVKNALSAHESEMTSLEAAYASAQAEGDFAASAKVQRQMAVLGGRIAQLETGRDALDQRIKATRADDGGQQQQPSEYDRKEAYIRTMPAKVQTWLRGSNGDRYFNDPDFQQKVASAASYAQNNKGIAPDSDQYIEFIETEVGLRQAPTPPANSGGAAPRGREPDDGRRMTTAPAGGSTAGSVRSNSDGSTTIYLTPDEKDMARRMGVPENEWAREKAAALKANQIGPNARR